MEWVRSPSRGKFKKARKNFLTLKDPMMNRGGQMEGGRVKEGLKGMGGGGQLGRRRSPALHICSALGCALLFSPVFFVSLSVHCLSVCFSSLQH